MTASADHTPKGYLTSPVPDAWHTSWIAAHDASRAAPLFRREFGVVGTIASASLDISGLGYYEASINGNRVGDHVLDPAQTDYERRVFYVTYDISDLVESGTNCIGVILGNGWYNQDRVWGDHGLCYGRPCLTLRLTVGLVGGETLTITSDEAWTCTDSPVTDNNIYAGERYDARREQTGWNRPGFNDSEWFAATRVAGPDGQLELQSCPPMRRISTRPPASIVTQSSGRYRLDFGQNFSGWISIRPHAPVGTEIVMRFAETLDTDGNIDTSTTGVFATGVEQVDHYICSGKAGEHWEPRFTYHGFRYVEITGWPGRLTEDAVTGIVVHTDLQTAGTFACSDERLNQLHQMALWTHRSNIHGLPEDCPARERCGWLGDANLVAEYSIWNYSSKSFWEKYLDDIETTRSFNDGIPGDVAPGRRGTSSPAHPDWAAAFIMLPWYVHLHYADATILARHWAGVETLMQHYASIAENWILPGGYGDFFDPGTKSIVQHTPPTLTTTLWFYRCASVVSSIASILGHTEQSAEYATWSLNIAHAFSTRFLDSKRGSLGSQTANAMALHFGILPDEEEDLFAALVKDILERNTHLNVGVMGIRYIFEELTTRGRGDLALALMHQNSYPGFGHLIERGATTLWESWGEDEHNGTHGPRSLNHPFMGGYDNWFYNTLAGIRIDENAPGFDHFYLEPHPIPGLNWVHGGHDCRYGRIESNWRTKGDQFLWDLIVPHGSSCTATLPFSKTRHALTPGSHTLTESTS